MLPTQKKAPVPAFTWAPAQNCPDIFRFNRSTQSGQSGIDTPGFEGLTRTWYTMIYGSWTWTHSLFAIVWSWEKVISRIRAVWASQPIFSTTHEYCGKTIAFIDMSSAVKLFVSSSMCFGHDDRDPELPQEPKTTHLWSWSEKLLVLFELWLGHDRMVHGRREAVPVHARVWKVVVHGSGVARHHHWTHGVRVEVLSVRWTLTCTHKITQFSVNGHSQN